jgi:serine/threonine protein kinase
MSSLAPGSVLGDFRIEGLVGRGGMGMVYHAVQISLGRPVALKLIAPHLADEEGFRQRFLQESRLSASIDHPHTVPVYGAGEEEGVPYIAMRFVEGVNLRVAIAAAERFKPARAARLVWQVASALDSAHERGLVHRDVKPANVLVTPEDHVYLTDFGLTKRIGADTEATRTGMVLGTLDYIAPEQIRGERIGPFTDIYSLGCMVTHLLTGQVPFTVPTEEGKMWAHFSEPPPLPSRRVPELGRSFDGIVTRAMSKPPQDRYATAGEVGVAMEAAAGGSIRRTASSSVPLPAWAGRVRRDVLVAALTDPFNVVLLGALLVTGALLGTVVLMIPLALLVYAAGVVHSYRNGATVRRSTDSRGDPRRGS